MNNSSLGENEQREWIAMVRHCISPQDLAPSLADHAQKIWGITHIKIGHCDRSVENAAHKASVSMTLRKIWRLVQKRRNLDRN